MTRPYFGLAGARAAACSVLLIGVSLSACDHAGPTAPAPVFTIVQSGIAERSASVLFILEKNQVPVPAASVTWSGMPASAVSIDSSGQAHFTDTGLVAISATASALTTTISVHVASPPTIVFDLQDSGGSGNRDVYRMGLDGLGLQQLSSGAGDNEQATAAGTRVIFTSYRNGAPMLYEVPLNGGTDARLDSAPEPASQAALSLDGSRLAFISPLGGVDHLWTSDGSGNGATAATGSSGFATSLEASPSWSPNGDTLTLVTTQFGNASLAVLAVAAGVETPITNDNSANVTPAWSPDGGRIAFSSTRDGDLGVFVLTLATGVVQRVTPAPGSDGEPGWLRDGRIVYTSNIGAATQLRWVDPAHPDTTWAILTPTGGNPRRPSASP